MTLYCSGVDTSDSTDAPNIVTLAQLLHTGIALSREHVRTWTYALLRSLDSVYLNGKPRTGNDIHTVVGLVQVPRTGRWQMQLLRPQPVSNASLTDPSESSAAIRLPADVQDACIMLVYTLRMEVRSYARSPPFYRLRPLKSLQGSISQENADILLSGTPCFPNVTALQAHNDSASAEMQKQDLWQLLTANSSICNDVDLLDLMVALLSGTMSVADALTHRWFKTVADMDHDPEFFIDIPDGL
jgi:hypothetical protein